MFQTFITKDKLIYTDMQIQNLINILKRYANSVLDREGWSIAFELKEDNNTKMYLKVKDRYINSLNEDKISLMIEIPVFTEIYSGNDETLMEYIKSYEQLSQDHYIVYKYKTDLFNDLANIFKNNKKFEQIRVKIQRDNYSYIKSLSVKNFYSIDHIELNEINGAKEVYLLGENGDGKSLVLMALHLAFNGRYIDQKSTYEYTGRLRAILKENENMILKAQDTNGTRYGGEKLILLQNLYAYGVHRGRYNSDNYEQYGFMSLYDTELQLFSPERLLKDTYLLSLENKVNINGRYKKTNLIQLETLTKLFSQLLENNVSIEVSGTEVMFVEKGFKLTFNQLSEGYKNIMIWVSDLIYRCQQTQPEVNKPEDFKGVVLIDEIELHLHPIWQRKFISQLRQFFPKIQFVLTTHSPTIIQGASDEAVIYKIYRDRESGKTRSSEAYFKKNLDHLMLNSLVTSPLFGLEDARVSSDADSVDTSNSYIQSRVEKRVMAELHRQKESGKAFLSDSDIDNLVDTILFDELKK